MPTTRIAGLSRWMAECAANLAVTAWFPPPRRLPAAITLSCDLRALWRCLAPALTPHGAGTESRPPRTPMVVSRGHDSLPAGGHGLVLVWMITAHESRTVASYRKNSSTEPGLDFEVVLEGDRDAFAVRNRPRSEGNRHMYNQALILMRCVVAAEEYSMALHPLPLIPVSSQHTRDLDDALGGRTALERQPRVPRGAEPTRGVTRT
jgi:hypothetical protein